MPQKLPVVAMGKDVLKSMMAHGCRQEQLRRQAAPVQGCTERLQSVRHLETQRRKGCTSCYLADSVAQVCLVGLSIEDDDGVVVCGLR